MEYKIIGDSLPAVTCYLNSGESVINESGSMAWMTPNMKMATEGGGIGKMFGRALTGESLFMNRYTAEGGQGEITFASSFPGRIMAFDVTPSAPIVVQKAAFLAGTGDVELSTHMNQKISGSMFGGEGFIMQKIGGTGTAFIEIDGYAVEYTLGNGESMIIDTGNLAMMDIGCNVEITRVKGAKNLLFGGEGLFNTVVKGPGRIVVQTMPISNVAAVLKPFFPDKN